MNSAGGLSVVSSNGGGGSNINIFMSEASDNASASGGGFDADGKFEEDKYSVEITNNHHMRRSSEDPNSKAKQEQLTLMTKYNVKTAAQAQKKFLEMKQERRELRTKLDKFQKDFETTHNRKIRYTKDIAPVANDFKRYKDMKGDI